jgi:chromosomal replication initiation ATPase DnaA
MNAFTSTRLSNEVAADPSLMEREIALMERAIAIHDRHAELKRQMEARGLTLIGSALLMTDIADVVAAQHGLTADELLGPSMLKPVCRARFEAMWVMDQRRREDGQKRWSRCQIGRFFHRDHTTVINGVRRHAERLAEASA